MAQHEEIVLWLDRRWKNAIEKHLKGETLQEHLETVLDELCNRLPEREYERISRAIQSEAAAQRAEEEAARTYAAYHVTECGQEWYFKTSPGEELLAVGKKLRGYVTKGSGVAPDKFIGMFFDGQPITAKEFDALTALRIPYRNFHVLRHTYASRCVEQGVDIKSLSEMLGHADVRTTLQVYVHSSLEHKMRVVQSICFLSLAPAADFAPSTFPSHGPETALRQRVFPNLSQIV